MLYLKLGHGPTLMYLSYPMKKERDVSKAAHQFLFEPLELLDGVTVRDIFELFKKDPVLTTIYRRSWAAEYVKEATKKQKRFKKETSKAESLQKLELYAQLSLDTHTQTMTLPVHLNVHGLTAPLKRDSKEHGVKKGECIQYSVSFSPLHELLDLPLSIKPTVPVIEDDIDSAEYNETIDTKKITQYTLGEVINSLLWELSFHGGPTETKKVADKLKKQVKDLDAGKLKTVSMDDMFDELDKPGIDLMFETIGDNKSHDVARSFRKIANTDTVIAKLAEEFGHSVIVKQEYRDLPSREFRKMFREAKYAERLKKFKSRSNKS